MGFRVRFSSANPIARAWWVHSRNVPVPSDEDCNAVMETVVVELVVESEPGVTGAGVGTVIAGAGVLSGA